MKTLEIIVLVCTITMFFTVFIIFAAHVRTDIAVILGLGVTVLLMILWWKYRRIPEYWLRLFPENYG
jgi:membrane protein implicated in regulation of membrane protease activity